RRLVQGDHERPFAIPRPLRDVLQGHDALADPRYADRENRGPGPHASTQQRVQPRCASGQSPRDIVSGGLLALDIATGLDATVHFESAAPITDPERMAAHLIGL